MMEYRASMTLWLWLWVGGFALLAFRSWKKSVPSVGLSIAYLFELTLYNWFGAYIYSLGYYHPTDPYLRQIGSNFTHTYLGFEQTFYGACAMIAGVLFFSPFFGKLLEQRERKQKSFPHPRMPRVYLFAGLFVTIVLSPLLGRIPSLSSVTAAGMPLIMAALCLNCWKAVQQGSKKQLLKTVFFTVLGLPVFTMLTGGFLGFGARAAMVVLMFLFCFYKPRWHLVIGGILAIFLGLSFFVNYMDSRGDLRSAVWGGEGYGQRAEEMIKIFEDFEFINLRNQKHLEAIDGRLNQNTITGISVNYLAEGYQEYAKGETLWQILIAPIPRIFWPEKPIKAGNDEILTKYSGMKIEDETSVGIGHVLDLYINFGTITVVIGFLILGTLLGTVDYLAAKRLMENKWEKFIFWMVVGIGFIDSIASVANTVMTIAAASFFSIVINIALRRYASRKIRNYGMNPYGAPPMMPPPMDAQDKPHEK